MTPWAEAILSNNAFRCFILFAIATITASSIFLPYAAYAKIMAYPSLFNAIDNQEANICSNSTLNECLSCEQTSEVAACETCFRAAAELCKGGCLLIEWPQANGRTAPKPCNAIPNAELPARKANSAVEKHVDEAALDFFHDLFVAY